MIGSIHGVIRGIIRETLVVDVSGVGYRVAVPVSTLTKAVENETILLWTHLAVRENAQDLYGFPTREELSWFELLLTVSGIGPKSALTIMNAVDIESLERAIGKNDPAMLSKAFGIGRKTAEKIVLELREKVGTTSSGKEIASGSDGDVIDALVGLGYSLREAQGAVHALPKELTTPETRLREAIRLASHATRR